MNTPLRRLTVVVFVMFLVLMGSTTWIQYGQAGSLNADQRNSRSIYREYDRPRGPIVVGSESVAFSEPVDTAFGYLREYTNGPLYAPVTGYFSPTLISTGIERASNDVLNGTADSLLWARIRALVTGGAGDGGTVELTIDSAVQQAAWDALGDQRGAAVALDPKTGEILAMVSKPSYDPNLLASHTSADVSAAYSELLAAEGDPLLNRAIGGRTYAPGSVFKLITTAMLLESGEYDADTEVPAPTEYQLPGSSATIRNPGGLQCGQGETVTLAYALQQSCNTPFAQLAAEIGPDALIEQATEFGFYQDFDIPLPVAQSVVGSDLDAAQTAMSAIGQFDVQTHPLQIAMVSAAIANDGVLMKPYLIGTERGPTLQVTSRTEPEEFSQPLSAENAEELTAMMVSVVAAGTGSPAQIEGIEVAGKTGTAESGTDSPHAWFTAFAPADDPQVVVAVMVEYGGDAGSEASGARVAAPIARQMILAALEGS